MWVSFSKQRCWCGRYDMPDYQIVEDVLQGIYDTSVSGFEP